MRIDINNKIQTSKFIFMHEIMRHCNVFIAFYMTNLFQMVNFILFCSKSEKLNKIMMNYISCLHFNW